MLGGLQRVAGWRGRAQGRLEPGGQRRGELRRRLHGRAHVRRVVGRALAGHHVAHLPAQAVRHGGHGGGGGGVGRHATLAAVATSDVRVWNGHTVRCDGGVARQFDLFKVRGLRGAGRVGVSEHYRADYSSNVLVGPNAQ